MRKQFYFNKIHYFDIKLENTFILLELIKSSSELVNQNETD